MRILVLTFLAGLWFVNPAAASFGNGEGYELDWKNPQEMLFYKSMGCGDACWSAAVLNRQTGKTKIELRCDGEKLFVSYGARGQSVLHQETCEKFNNCAEKNCKSVAITLEMERLLAMK